MLVCHRQHQDQAGKGLEGLPSKDSGENPCSKQPVDLPYRKIQKEKSIVGQGNHQWLARLFTEFNVILGVNHNRGWWTNSKPMTISDYLLAHLNKYSSHLCWPCYPDPNPKFQFVSTACWTRPLVVHLENSWDHDAASLVSGTHSPLFDYICRAVPTSSLRRDQCW